MSLKAIFKDIKITDWITIVIAGIALIISLRTCSLQTDSNDVAELALGEAAKANQHAVRSSSIAEESNRIASLAKELAKEANKISLKSNEIAEQSNRIANSSITSNEKLSELANKFEKDALENSIRFNVINAEVSWNILLDSYNEINIVLVNYEKSQKLQKRDQPIQNISQLEDQLNKLTIPEDKKELYRKLFQKYQSLESIARQWEPFKDRLTNIDMKLPEPPRVPKATLRGVSGSGFSIN